MNCRNLRIVGAFRKMGHPCRRSARLAEITRRVVDYFRPERIYLFALRRGGDGGPDSDLDFCVVLPDDAPEGFYKPSSREALRGIATAVDIVRLPAGNFDLRAEHVRALLPATIVREWRLLYDARTVAA